jgi:large subunit ribosomal protein L10
MQVARTKPYPERKRRMYNKIKELAKSYRCIASAGLYKVRATQLMELKKLLRGKVEILAIKNKLAALALKEAKIPKEFISKLVGQRILIFTNMDPFRLNLILEKNKIDMPAKAGDVATNDILIPAGNTGIPPGPILSDFKSVNVPTRIDSGSIWVTKDTLVAKKGEVISLKLANLLSRLNLKPIKAGISIDFAYYDNILLTSEDIKIEPKEYEDMIKSYVSEAITLAASIAYPAKEVLPTIIAKASTEALALAKEIAYPAKEVLPTIIGKAEGIARAILERVKDKGYSTS